MIFPAAQSLVFKLNRVYIVERRIAQSGVRSHGHVAATDSDSALGSESACDVPVTPDSARDTE
jgi:hypothetical protein